ncbi:MAG TPA: glycoside hydrolase family 76 protein [Thermomicrobiales bacterium]|nr:glycoside hydrolase family 76 protein [Thermomicrobiales bacterium]
MRRALCGLFVVAVAVGLAPGAARAAGPPPDPWFPRARDANAALVGRFASDTPGLFRERAPAQPDDRRYSYAWPFSQALAAELDVAGLPGGDPATLARARQLWQSYQANYFDAAANPPGGASYPLADGGGDKYYDDNAWAGLNAIDVYRATGDRAALADAAKIFAFIAGGWDTDPKHPSPGGVFWTRAPVNATGDRNTVSTAPAAQLALHLYAFTGDAAYLDWARRMFDWVEHTLKDPADGLYWDHIRLDGTVEKTKWSYNQGAMLGAAALFYRYTGDAGYLHRGQQIAGASLAYYGAADRLWAQDPIFNAIYFRNLQTLDLSDGDQPGAAYLPLLTAYAERAWTQGRDPVTGLFTFGRPGPATLADQAAAVQLFATLAANQQDVAAFADAAFRPVWARGDAPVAAGAASRTWLWGPGPDGPGMWERFDEGLDGRHLVQYFDKSRMEVNDANGDRTSSYYVTQGLLAEDMILGRVQVGVNRFEQRAPAAVPFGDPDDAQGPTYASLTGLLGAPPAAPGQPVATSLARSGATGPADPRGVTCAAIVAETRHCVASVFWDYLNSAGTVYQGGGYVSGPLFAPLFYATGLPISEAYWTELKVAGTVRPVLVQAFERRILTYDPANPAGWQVEMGNVGRHYYQWRYGRELPAPTALAGP